MHTSNPKASVGVQPPNPLLNLPTEIIQRIAYLLPTDSDIAHFSSCCKSLAEQTVPAESSIWRQRFGDIYDTPPDRSSSELKVEYQIRAVVLAQTISFKQGEKESQTLWLTILRDMILESFHLARQKTDGGAKTLRRIRGALRDSEFLNRPVSGHGLKQLERPSELFCAVQLSLTGLALDPDMSVQCLRTDYDIGSVYSYRSEYDRVIPEGLLDINPLEIQRLLHIRNFWLRHLLNPVEATFHASYAKLAPEHRPAALTNNDSPVLETQWLGYYSCIHPYPGSRSALDKRQSCADLDNHLTQVDCMSLILKPGNDPLNWPPVFQELIPLGDGADRLYFRGIQRYHNSDDHEINFVRGFMEPNQTAEGGFTAWQRICFVIYEADREILPLLADDGSPSDGEVDWLPNETWPPVDLGLDFACIHGYEARLLPGGRIMLGQWVDMLDTTGRGPFIFWNI